MRERNFTAMEATGASGGGLNHFTRALPKFMDAGTSSLARSSSNVQVIQYYLVDKWSISKKVESPSSSEKQQGRTCHGLFFSTLLNLHLFHSLGMQNQHSFCWRDICRTHPASTDERASPQPGILCTKFPRTQCTICSSYLYCSERVYFIFFSMICKHKIHIFMFVGVYFYLAPVFWDCHPVLSLTAFWALNCCRKVTFSCSIDTGVILKPWDSICNNVVYAFSIDDLGPELFQQ